MGLFRLTSRENTRFGDSAKIHAAQVVGGVQITIMEGMKIRGSIVLDEDRTRWFIGALCKLVGVNRIEFGKPKEGA